MGFNSALKGLMAFCHCRELTRIGVKSANIIITTTTNTTTKTIIIIIIII